MNLTREDLEKVLRAMYDNVVASAHNNVSDAVQAGLDAPGELPAPEPKKDLCKRLRLVRVEDLVQGDTMHLNSRDAVVDGVQKVVGKGYVRVLFKCGLGPMAFSPGEQVYVWR